MEKEKYDLIISLGGNCAAANQCLHRNLRQFSLPFDYTFMVDSRPIEYFAEGLKDNFKNFCLKENIVELVGSERGDEKAKFQYKDTYSGYRLIHLFKNYITNDDVYEKGYKTMRRRIDRLYEKLEKAKKVLIICATDFVYDEKYIYKVKETFEELYPDKEFVFYTLMFNADEYSEKQNENMFFIYSRRSVNVYDISSTNYEWHFLDDIQLTKMQTNSIKILSFKLLKKRIILTLSWQHKS